MKVLENTKMRPHTGPLARVRPVDSADGATPESAEIRWTRALKGVVAAAFRLHHYRFVRTRMLHDALRASRSDISAVDSSPPNRPENLPENQR